MMHTEMVDPVTGEFIDLAALDTDGLLDTHRRVGRVIDHARDARRMVEDEMERRRRAEGPAATGVDGTRLRATSTLTRRWDATMVHGVLGQLVDAKIVPPDEALALIPEVMVHKPNGRGLNALLSRLMTEDTMDAARDLLAARTETRRWTVVAADDSTG